MKGYLQCPRTLCLGATLRTVLSACDMGTEACQAMCHLSMSTLILMMIRYHEVQNMMRLHGPQCSDLSGK